ncbi:hypothetical protein [Amycolatopsis sp. NPDC049868]|uniref:hypothetical protein n=1 Tax=Amycolatopsis sp. NPDC049868 TaxID=3363934 RepID=UPI0037B5EE9F
MRAIRFIGATCAAVAITTVLGGSAQAAEQPAGRADAEKSFCMDRAGYFRDSGKGKTVKGRYTIVQTESIADVQAAGYAEDISTGDRVVVQRSHQKFEMRDKPWYPDDSLIGDNYGSCRSPKATWYDANVRDWIKSPAVALQIWETIYSYAVRSCVETPGGYRGCTAWYVDHL